MSMRLGQVSISVSALLVAWISGTTALRAATPSPFEFEQVSPWSAANGASLAVSDLRTQGQDRVGLAPAATPAISTRLCLLPAITSSLSRSICVCPRRNPIRFG